MKFVCPLPIVWNEVYTHLHSSWLKGGSQGAPSPVPLVLGGWVYSNDLDKKRRWDTTVEWARERGLQKLIPEFEESQSYMTAELTTYVVGPMGGPMYLKWDYSPKPTPSAAELESALLLLRTKWDEIAGSTLASHSKPLRFTGKKRRRLLVQADPTFAPEWGTWNVLKAGNERRAFTRFRKAVNDRISPLKVDHIDFVLLESAQSVGGSSLHAGQSNENIQRYKPEES